MQRRFIDSFPPVAVNVAQIELRVRIAVRRPMHGNDVVVVHVPQVPVVSFDPLKTPDLVIVLFPANIPKHNNTLIWAILEESERRHR